MSPETNVASVPYNGMACDVWCLGIMLYVMLFGVFPFAEDRLCVHYESIRQGQLYSNLVAWGWSARASDAARDLMAYMLDFDAARRPTIEQVYLHEWFAPLRAALDGDDGNGDAPAAAPAAAALAGGGAAALLPAAGARGGAAGGAGAIAVAAGAVVVDDSTARSMVEDP